MPTSLSDFHPKFLTAQAHVDSLQLCIFSHVFLNALAGGWGGGQRNSPGHFWSFQCWEVSGRGLSL